MTVIDADAVRPLLFFAVALTVIDVALRVPSDSVSDVPEVPDALLPFPVRDELDIGTVTEPPVYVHVFFMVAVTLPVQNPLM